jgi:hypothetical protein
MSHLPAAHDRMLVIAEGIDLIRAHFEPRVGAAFRADEFAVNVESTRELLALGADDGLINDGILKTECDRGHARRLTRSGSGENDIEHGATTQAFRTALAEHPLDRIDDVALTATVRTDHADDAVIEAKLRGVRETLKAAERQLGKPHPSVTSCRDGEPHEGGGGGRMAQRRCPWIRPSSLRACTEIRIRIQTPILVGRDGDVYRGTVSR